MPLTRQCCEDLAVILGQTQKQQRMTSEQPERKRSAHDRLVVKIPLARADEEGLRTCAGLLSFLDG